MHLLGTFIFLLIFCVLEPARDSFWSRWLWWRNLPGFHGHPKSIFWLRSPQPSLGWLSQKRHNTNVGIMILNQRSTPFFKVGHSTWIFLVASPHLWYMMKSTSSVHICAAMGQVSATVKWCATLKASHHYYLIFLGKQCHTKTFESIIGIFKDACHLDPTQFN